MNGIIFSILIVIIDTFCLLNYVNLYCIELDQNIFYTLTYLVDIKYYNCIKINPMTLVSYCFYWFKNNKPKLICLI